MKFSQLIEYKKKNIFLRNQTDNEEARLVSHPFFFKKKKKKSLKKKKKNKQTKKKEKEALNEVKANGLQLSSIYFYIFEIKRIFLTKPFLCMTT